MSEAAIPIHIRRFLEQNIRSVAQLELLLLLRNTPGKTWSAREVANEMRLDQAWVRPELRELESRGFLTSPPDREDHFRYEPRAPEIQTIVTEVAQAYLLHRVRLIEVIYQQPSEQIRAFADAFRLRKEHDRG